MSWLVLTALIQVYSESEQKDTENVQFDGQENKKKFSILPGDLPVPWLFSDKKKVKIVCWHGVVYPV